MWDLQLNQGHDHTLRQPEGWSTALVVLEGEVIINGSESAREGQLAVLSEQVTQYIWRRPPRQKFC